MGELNSTASSRAKKTKKIAVIEGCAHSTMVGFGEQYIVPFALKLGATNSQIAILSAVPYFFGSISQTISAKLSSVAKSRKKLVATFAFLQGVSLVPLFLLPFFTRNVLALTLMFTIYLVLGNMASPPWNSMISDVVKDGERPEYFAKRNKAMLITLVLSTIAAGIILENMSKYNIWIAFWALFSLAFLGKTTSVILLLNYFEPAQKVRKRKEESLLQFIKGIKKNNFGHFVLFRSFLELAVMLGGPFLAIYWLKTLEFNYVQFSILSLTGLVIRAIASPFWGHNAKRYGNRNMMFIAAVLVAILPLGWFLAGMLFGATHYAFVAFIFTEILTGFAWSGLDLTTFTYTLENAKGHNTAIISAHLNVILGTFTMIGGIIGSVAVYLFGNMSFSKDAILVMFFISFIARMSAALSFMSKVKELKKRKVNDRKLFMRLILTNPIGSTLHGTLYRLDSFVEMTEKKRHNHDGRVVAEMEKLQTETLRIWRKDGKAKKKKAYKNEKGKKKSGNKR